ncbi:hypothetical protein [Nocardiopsis synnemataformans]|uniref:hypothetical protein n=1 Tax=Nocardiopsis synnemataformans TaxID=61305 RepID=UPI003EC017D8
MDAHEILHTILRTYATMRVNYDQPPAICIDAAMLAACQAAVPTVPDDLSGLFEDGQGPDGGSSL